MPAVVLALNGTITLASSKASIREMDAQDFILGPFETAREDNEILLSISWPSPPASTGSAYKKWGLVTDSLPVVGICVNVTLDPEDEVFPILGGKEAIHHLSMLMLSDQDVCLSPTPGYPPYRSGPILAGGQIFSMPLAEENGFQPDLSSIPSTVLEKAKLIYLNYPNNPTGAVATDAFFC